MIDLALRMLLGDRARFALLVSGVCFATILMAQGVAMFFGIISFSYATADNVRAAIWVVDPLVQQVQDNQPLRDTDVERVRSVDGVAWAVPLFVGQTQARLVEAGVTKPVTLVGLDDTSLAGAPTRMVEGSALDLRRADGVIVDVTFTRLFETDPARPIRVGDVFEMNDRRAQIVGIADGASGMGGAAYVYTAFRRTRDYVAGGRSRVTHVLAAPAASRTVADVIGAIESETGLRAYSEDAFKDLTSRWMITNSPIPFVVGLIVGIGFLVGVVVSGQTFYTFVLENLRFLAVLKAMGAGTGRIAVMVMVQAGVVGLIGYGLGVGALSLFFRALPAGRVPLLMLWPVPVVVAVAVAAICVLAGLISVRRVARIEPARVFQS